MNTIVSGKIIQSLSVWHLWKCLQFRFISTYVAGHQITHASRSNFKMSTMLTDCLSCKKSFRSLYSLKKHRRDRHKDNSPVVPVFKDTSGNIVLLPQPRQQLDSIDLAGYKLWVAGLVERINATLHPRLPGKLKNYARY